MSLGTLRKEFHNRVVGGGVGDNDPHSFILWRISKVLLFLCDRGNSFQDTSLDLTEMTLTEWASERY